MRKLIVILICLSIVSPSWSAITVQATNSEASATSNGFTTINSVDTTGATLIVVVLSSYNLGGGRACSLANDTQGGGSNTYVALTTRGTGISDFGTVQTYYSNGSNLTNTGASHTWTTSACSAAYPTMQIFAFKGTATSSVFDAEDGITTPDTTATSFSAPTGVTPAGCSEVLVTGENDSVAQGDTITLDGTYTMLSPTFQFVAGNHIASASGYKIKSGSDSAAENPTWGPTMNQGTFSPNATTELAAFKSPSGSCGGGASTPVCPSPFCGIIQ